MHDTAKRRHPARHLIQDFRKRGSVGHVAGARQDLDAAPLEPRQHGLRFLGTRAAAAEEHEMARAAICEPFGGSQAKAAQAAGDQETRLAGQMQARLLR